MKKINIYGLSLARTTEEKAAKYLCACAEKKIKKTVFTPNLQILCRAKRSARLRSILKSADLLLPDGAGVTLLCRLSHKPPIKRVTGIDTAYALLEHAARNGLSVFLLGAKSDVARLARLKLCAEIPRLRVCGIHHGYFDKKTNSKQNSAVISKIRAANPDILLVCFGFPMQEEWILQNRDALPCVKVFMGIGGSLDVWSGKVARAPEPLRACGLEWLWRCAHEPKRFIRLFKDVALQ